MNLKQKQFTGFLLSCAALVGVDQWTKFLAVDRLKGQSPFVLIDGVFELTYLENRGAAFGMMQGKQLIFFFIAAAVIAAAVYCILRMPDSRRYLPLYCCAVAVTAGAIGNMIDRLSQGYVVDFLYFRLIHFPVFNVADCYVTAGAALLILLILFYYKDDDLEPFSFHSRKGGSL